jgi:hypothetical protein
MDLRILGRYWKRAKDLCCYCSNTMASAIDAGAIGVPRLVLFTMHLALPLVSQSVPNTQSSRRSYVRELQYYVSGVNTRMLQ